MIPLQTRKLVLKWNNEGKTQQQIADLVGCNQSAVSRLIKKYNQTGEVNNLPRSGRPTKLTKTRMAKLKSKITAIIKEANEKFCSVSTKQVADLISKEVGKSYSHRHVERLLHKMDFSLVTPRPQHIRHDQKKVDAFREELKKNLRKSMWTTN